MVFWFVGLTVAAVGKTAGEVGHSHITKQRSETKHKRSHQRSFRLLIGPSLQTLIRPHNTTYPIDALPSFEEITLTILCDVNLVMQVVKEVRRQFRDNPDIMTFKAKPDYRSCVALVSTTAPAISLPFSPHFRQ